MSHYKIVRVSRLMRVGQHLHRDESGMFSLSHLAATLFLTLALLCLLNVGTALNDRARLQRRADAAAESLGTWKARYLNSVVAQQHLIGEMLGLAIAHHAIGGDLLDRREAANTTKLDRALRAAHATAQGCRTRTPAFDDVSSPVLAGEALLESHKQLKKLLTIVYITKTAAMLMQVYPPTRPAGEALEDAADLVERAIHAEWDTLESIRGVALNTSETKAKMLKEWIPKAKKQLVDLIDNYPTSQKKLADAFSEKFQIKIGVLASDQHLPLMEDPLARLMVPPADWKRPLDCDCPTEPADNLRYQLVKVSQLARATFPWVNYHRHPLITKMRPLTPLSGMADHYFDHTAGVTRTLCDEKQRDGAWALYVLKDYAGPDKAFETWMKPNGSDAADKSFGLTVFVGQGSREPIGSFLFRRQSGDMSYRIASAFVRNRHVPVQPQQRIDLYCKRIIPSIQAETGWDTLNWQPGTKAYELVGFGIPQIFPKVEPAWTSALAPTTAARLRELRTQARPDWAHSLSDVLPASITPELVGL